MSSFSSRVLRPAQWVPMLIVAAALVSVGVAGGRMQARPTAVAVVDLSAVLEKLDQRSAMLEGILQQFNVFKAQGEERARQQTEREAEIAPLEEKRRAGTITAAELEQYMTLRDAAVKFRIATEAFNARAGRTVDREMGLALEELYNQARAEAGELARANGFDIVLVDDSDLEIQIDRQSPREQQVLAQLRNRRVLYAGDAADITQALIDRMNNAFKAGG
ncbi:MAG: hypothetical protein AB8G96_14840 [Phycisphaerales bacterium]